MKKYPAVSGYFIQNKGASLQKERALLGPLKRLAFFSASLRLTLFVARSKAPKWLALTKKVDLNPP
jgi:hypothetical protein